MSDPTLVMLDEPMAGVNPALTESLLDHILDLKDLGMTVLFVEHDMHMVRHIADWVVVMAEGRIVAEGPPEAVMQDQAVIDAYLGSHQDVDLGVVTGRIAGELDDRGGRAARGDPRRAGCSRSKRRGGDAMSLAPDRPAPPGAKTDEIVVEMTDVVAGYLPGVNILNGANLDRPQGRARSASSARTAPASRRC